MTKIINENEIYNMLNTTPRLKNEKAENKQNLIYFFLKLSVHHSNYVLTGIVQTRNDN